MGPSGTVIWRGRTIAEWAHLTASRAENGWLEDAARLGDTWTVIRPFKLSSCPRVAAREARATRAALPIVAHLPEEWSWDAPPLGRASGAIVGVGQASANVGSGAVGLVLAAGTQAGRLSLDTGFASRLVDNVLSGRRTRSTTGSFGPAERGVLVSLLGRAFEGTGWYLRLGPLPAAPHAGVTVAVRLTVPGVGIGVVRLELPEGASVSPLGWEHRRARVNRLTVVARVEIAATNLAAADASSLSVGDAVVFEGMRPLSASAEHWDARLVVGRGVDQLVASVRIAADGTGTASEGFGREHQLTEEETMDSASTTVLAATPIEVVAELGRITLRGDEVLGLSPGAVLAVGARVRQVTVRVGGAAWAEGEIVDIEGELGVRITKLLVG